jgi:hypothetical protein
LRIAENVSCFTSSANYFGHDLHRAIDDTVPRNSEVMIRWSGFGSIAAGNSSPSANPQAKGTTIPAADVLMAARPAYLTSLRSVSIRSAATASGCQAATRHRSWPSVAGPGEDRALRLGPDRAEYGRPKQNSGDQLPHYGRLGQRSRWSAGDSRPRFSRNVEARSMTVGPW